MHETFEDVQHAATPVIRGPVKVYFVLVALLISVLTPTTAGHLASTILFVGLSIHAVGVRPVLWFGIPVAFVLPGVAIILLVTPGPPVFEWWVVSISSPAIQTAGGTLSRSIASLSILAFLVLTTPIQSVLSSLRRIPLPGIVLELFLYVYRAIQLTIAEAVSMRTAGHARLGFRNRRTSYRTTKLLATSLLVRSFDRIERFGDSLRARNYNGTLPVPAEFESRGYGYAGAILCLVIVVGWL